MPDWNALLAEHGPIVWKTAYRLLGNRADADDAYQETFADALRWIDRDRPSVVHWRAFLVRLATARAVDRLRSRYTRTRRERGGEMFDTLRDPDRRSMPHLRAEDAEQHAQLRGWIAELPPKQAEAFCLHCLEQFSYCEVAESLGTSVDHVGVLISRARAKLRVRVAECLSRESLSTAIRPKPVNE